jgi:hypothetical protein
VPSGIRVFNRSWRAVIGWERALRFWCWLARAMLLAPIAVAIAIWGLTAMGWAFRIFDHDHYIIAVMSPYTCSIAASHIAWRRASRPRP